MSKIDLVQLQKELKNLNRWQPLYKLLKSELTKQGYWRLKTLGNPQKGFAAGWGKHGKRKIMQ